MRFANGTDSRATWWNAAPGNRGVTMDFSRPGKPTDNPFVESFNGSFWDECLNVRWFPSLDDARHKIESCRRDYNHFRTHSSLGDIPPVEFAAQFTPTR